MSREPEVTTIIPTYRRPVLLKRAVLSVINQSFPDFVVQIMDNASGDETDQVAAELMRMDSRVRYHRQADDIGAMKNIIDGMARVTTRYFNVLCDDDFLMPEFLATGVRLHEEGDRRLAFVSTRVAVLDETGAFSTPFPHPGARCRLSPPNGMARCLKAGVSLTGVLYRTRAMREVGAPRLAWWNWTESGWHALAAITAPIEFSPEVGAIMYDHRAGGSKQMDGLEFRLSWFRMLVDVRNMAARSGVSSALWRRQMGTRQWGMFLSSCLRVSRDRDVHTYDELRELGINSGLSPAAVVSALNVARAVRSISAGGLLNGAIDGLLKVRDVCRRALASRSRPQTSAGLASLSSVLVDLNEQAGVAPHRAT